MGIAMPKQLTKLILILLFFFPIFALADETIFQTISRANYNGDADLTYFSGPGKWGAPACPNATYVQVKASVLGRKQILSMGLTAQVSGKKVQFWCTCDANLDYFNAFYIVVQ